MCPHHSRREEFELGFGNHRRRAFTQEYPRIRRTDVERESNRVPVHGLDGLLVRRSVMFRPLSRHDFDPDGPRGCSKAQAGNREGATGKPRIAPTLVLCQPEIFAWDWSILDAGDGRRVMCNLERTTMRCIAFAFSGHKSTRNLTVAADFLKRKGGESTLGGGVSRSGSLMEVYRNTILKTPARDAPPPYFNPSSLKKSAVHGLSQCPRLQAFFRKIAGHGFGLPVHGPQGVGPAVRHGGQ